MEKQNQKKDGTKKDGTGRNDALWKGLIEDLIEDFVAFFLPRDAADYDLSKVRYCDKELEVLLDNKDEARVKKFVDKLIEVKRKSKKGKKELIHIEVEGSTNAELPARMFLYGLLINTKYRLETNAFVIFTGSKKTGGDQFIRKSGSAIWTYNYGTYYVNNQNINDLKKSQNPIAIVIMTLKLYLMRNKLSDDELTVEFEWIFAKLEISEISLDKREKIDMFLTDYVTLCIRNPETRRSLVDKIRRLTKNDKAMGIKEMVLEQGRKEGRKEGREEGREEGGEVMLKNNIKQLLNHKLSMQKVAELLGINLDYVTLVAKDLKTA